MVLVNGRAKQAQVYPRELCQAMIEAYLFTMIYFKLTTFKMQKKEMIKSQSLDNMKLLWSGLDATLGMMVNSGEM